MQFSGKCPHLWATDSVSYLLSLPHWPHKSYIPFLHSRTASAETWLHAKLQTNSWLLLLRNWSSGLKPLHSEEGSKATLLFLWVQQFHGCLITAPVAEQVIPSAAKAIKPVFYTKALNLPWSSCCSQILATTPTPVCLAKWQHILVGLVQCYAGHG